VTRGWSNPKYRPLWVGALALGALPLLMPLLGLTVNTASVTVILAIAALGLNLLVGYTGLTSFGHAAWFGIGAYVAAIAQKNWLHGQILLPILASVAFVAILSSAAGFLILRRRGVYFSLLTLALCALTYAVAFRWTAVTGGEDGLGGLQRGAIGPLSLDNALTYYALVALTGLGVLYVVLRVVRSPFGHVLVAIRENQQRATFQGYAIDRYKLGAFVLSASVTALAGALLGFQNYLVSAGCTTSWDPPWERCSSSCSGSCSPCGAATGCSGSGWCSSVSCCIRRADWWESGPGSSAAGGPRPRRRRR